MIKMMTMRLKIRMIIMMIKMIERWATLICIA